MKLATISKDIRKENRTKILIKKRKFKKSLFSAKIFRFKLNFFSKCPEIGKITIIHLKTDNRDLCHKPFI